MRGRYVERKGGWDCHGLPVEIAVEQKLGFTQQARHRALRHRRVQRAVPRVGLRVPRGLDGADRADRLLGRPRAPVPDARPHLHRVGLVGAAASCGTRTCSTRATRSCPTARATARRCPRTRSRRATRTSRTRRVYVKFPVTAAGGRAARGRHSCWSGRRRPGRSSPTPPSPSTRSSTYVRTADGLRARRGARRARARRGRRGRRPLHGRATCSAPRYEPPFAFIAGDASTARRATPCCPATSSPPTTAPASSTPRSRSARTTSGSAQEQGLNVVNPVRLDGTYDERIGPYAGRWVKDADADLIEDLRARGRLLRAETLPARLPALLALRHAAALLRQAVLVHPHLALRDRLLAANETVDWHPRAHQARALRRAGWRTTSTGRSRASATGARRCRSGAARTATPSASARSPSSRSSPASTLEDPHRPYVDDVDAARARDVRRADAPRARGDRRLVRLGLDAVRPVARAVREPGASSSSSSRPTTSARRSTRRAAGSTRCSRSRRCCSTARPTRPCSASATSPTPRARRCRSRSGNIVVPWDVIDAPRRRRVPLVLPDLQAAVGRLPVLADDGRRVAAPVPAAAVEHVRLLRPVRERQRRRAERDARPADRPRPLGALAAGARRSTTVTRAPGRTTTPRAPARRSPAFVDDLSNWYVRRSRRRFWDGDPAAFATLRTCLVTVAKLLAPFTPVHRRRDLRQPRRRRAERAPRATCPSAGRARRGARVRDGRRARDGRPRARRARPGQAQGAPAAARRRGGRRRRASARRSSGWPTSCCEELNVKELRYVSQADELGSYEVKPNYRALGPRFGKQMPQVAAAVAALDPAHVAARAARRRPRRHQRRRPRPRARRRRPAARDAAARGLPARARGLARGRARARARRRAAPRGPRARDRPRGPERAQGGRPARSRTGSSCALGGDDELLRPPASTRAT